MSALSSYGSAYGACSAPGVTMPNPDRWRALLAVSERLPSERPWKAPRKAMALGRPVWWRASLRAASTASVPELARNTRGSGIGASAASRVHSSAYAGR